MEFIAHRGASAHAPENTLASFKKALEMGASAIELDIALSLDGRLVVIHDADIKRVAGKPGRVENFTAAELKKTDVGSWFEKKYCDQGVPTLADVFQLVKNQATLHVEIKGGCGFYPGIEEKLSRLLKHLDPFHASLVSSFDHEALYHFRKLDKKARIGYLLGRTPLPRAFLEIAEIGAESLNLDLKQVNSKIISECHKRDLKVLVYTVNTRRDFSRLKKMGVDGVFSNFPELASHA
jgi:glycerophosphoryl diester phosphodiesterase